MVFGTIVGAAIGVSGGYFCFRQYMPSRIPPPSTYDYIDVAADSNSEYRAEWDVDAKDEETKRVLSRSPYWCTWPDYDRVLWLNQMIHVLWEKNALATEKVVRQVIVDGLPEWQKLTAEATSGLVQLEDVKIETFTLGDSPFRFSGFKLYSTSQDEIIMDGPLQWGSNADVRVSASVVVADKLGYPVKLYVPIQIKNIQVSGLARLTLKPLVEDLPVIGAVHISLVDDPIIDMELFLGDGPDIMGFPLMRQALRMVVKMAIGMIFVYPNEMSFPVMHNSGLAPPIQGMLKVKVLRATGLPSSVLDKIDPYVEIEVRKGRSLKTKVIDDEENPVWEDEELRFVIDDPTVQTIKLKVKDSDIFADTTVGDAELPMDGAPFVLRPGRAFNYKVGLRIVTKKDRKKGTDEQAEQQVLDEHGILKSLTEGGVHAWEVHKKYAAEHHLDEEPEGGEVPTEVLEPGLPGKEEEHLPHKKGKRHHFMEYMEAQMDKRKKDKLPDVDSDAVVIPGSGARGQVYLEITYIPFRQAEKITALNTLEARRVQIATISHVTEADRGVVTATLIRCINLPDGVDPYVVIALYDDLQRTTERVKSSVKLNESNPRWDMKFDFVYVSAFSRMTVQVFDKSTGGFLPGPLNTVAKIITKPQKKKLGWLEIPLTEVAKNGLVKNRWNLRDAPKGFVELKLEWHAVRTAAGQQDSSPRIDPSAPSGSEPTFTPVSSPAVGNSPVKSPKAAAEMPQEAVYANGTSSAA